jgi:hypothetical protein
MKNVTCERAPNDGAHAYYRTDTGKALMVTDGQVDQMRTLLARGESDLTIRGRTDIDADMVRSIVAAYDRWKERAMEQARMAIADAIRSVPKFMRDDLVSSISRLVEKRQ